MADTAQRSSSAVRSLGELALAAADRHSGEAMRAPARPTLTYADFGRAIREIAGGLAALGVGVGDKVGTIDVGRQANLVLMSGDFADDKSVVETVFVEGKRVDVKKGGGK